MRTIIIIALALLSMIRVKAQVDSTKTDSLDNLDITIDQSMKLLPDHILITQRIFWGQKGLMRNISFFKLTPEKRQRELSLRRTMLVAHQVGGFITLGGMVAQGIVGYKLYEGDRSMRDAHESLASFVNFTYFTTAALALLAPPKMLNEHKGYSNIKVHKALAIIHFTSMIATNILAGQLESNPNLRVYHKAAAYTAFGAFAAAMIIIKF
jgi:hypothetical protein